MPTNPQTNPMEGNRQLQPRSGTDNRVALFDSGLPQVCRSLIDDTALMTMQIATSTGALTGGKIPISTIELNAPP